MGGSEGLDQRETVRVGGRVVRVSIMRVNGPQRLLTGRRGGERKRGSKVGSWSCPVTKLRSLERAAVSPLLPSPDASLCLNPPHLSPCLLPPHLFPPLVPSLPPLLHPSPFRSPVASGPQARDTALQKSPFIHSTDLTTSSGPRG